MSSLTSVDRLPLESLFGMSTGYVLDLTNAGFKKLVEESTGLDIYSDKYAGDGTSKAKRLRAFWALESDDLAAQITEALLRYEEATSSSTHPLAAELRITCRQIVQNLSGLSPGSLPGTDAGVPLLTEDFSDISLDDLELPPELISILRSRLDEASFCLSAGAHLAVVILSGSVLEGLLLGLAKGSPHRFNQAKSAPKDRDGQVRRLAEWSLAHLIEAATELRFLSPDVKQFSSALREFRNYVHPNQQLEARFQPDEHTARISLQVLRAAIADVTGLRGSRRPIESGP